MTPYRRRVAVVRLKVRFGVSQRRACAVVGQHPSTQRRSRPARVDADGVYGQWLCDFAQRHPRWGWRKAHDVAAREGLVTNPKRTLRLGVLIAFSGLRNGGTNAGVSVTAPRSSCAPSTRTMCGRWTSSSTRPPHSGV